MLRIDNVVNSQQEVSTVPLPEVLWTCNDLDVADYAIDGAKLTELRKGLGLGLRELARAAGVDPGQLSRIENGKAPGASAIDVAKLCGVLGVSIDAVMGAEVGVHGDVREEVIRLLGRTKHPRAIAELREHVPPTPDVSAEYWVRTLDALDAKHRAERPRKSKAG